jgi:hypothetical protein
LLAPHKLVDLEGGNKNRESVPVFLADEINVKFPRPLICYILLLGMLRSDRAMNMVPEFVKENMTEDDLPQKRNMKGRPFEASGNLIYPKLDVR